MRQFHRFVAVTCMFMCLLATQSLGRGIQEDFLDDPLAFASDPALLPTAKDIRQFVSFQGDEVLISSCFYGSDPTSDREDEFVSAIQRFIWSFEVTRGALERVGYPRDVVAEALLPVRDAYVRHMRAQYRRGDQYPAVESLPSTVYDLDLAAVRTLNEFRQGSPLNLPAVYGSDDAFCGGDYYGENYLTTADDAGRVFVIKDFNYNLCVGNDFDPYDRTRCNLWEEAVNFLPDGMYRYFVEWDDGSTPTTARLMLENEMTYVIKKRR